MSVHHARRRLPYPRERVFDLVADVERYPEFLPWWVAARIIRREAEGYRTEQIVRFGVLRERFTSKTVLARPRRIDVAATSGPFRAFRLSWTFTPAAGGGCDVGLEARVELWPRALDRLFAAVLARSTSEIVDAFVVRAHKVLAGGDENDAAERAGAPRR